MGILTTLIYLVIIPATAISMEGVAWFLHKYVMHGFGWYIHEDHHRGSTGRFEKNDVFGLFFSILSFILILTGFLQEMIILLVLGIGIMIYGLGYFLVHDIFFHRRIKIRYHPKSPYIQRVLNAHAVHHQKSTAHTGLCFGFLYAHKKYAPDS